MDGEKSLIHIESMALAPITEEILALNEKSSKYGLILSEKEAAELSEIRNNAIVENDRIEIGCGAVKKIVDKFCSSRYLNAENYSYTLNELTYLFYYIKTETDDKISDNDLIEELFERFELYCRGSIDTLENREAERIIRKVNSGKNYTEWYRDRDELDYTSRTGQREAPGSLIGEEYDYEEFADDEYADHDNYEADEFDDMYDDGFDLDAFDEFLDMEAADYDDDKDDNIASEEYDDEEDDDLDYDE